MYSLLKNAKTIRLMNGIAAGTTSQNSSVVDCQGFDGVRFTALFGTLTAGQTTSIKIQQSSVGDGTGMADLLGSSVGPLADGDSNKCLVVDVHRAQKRYLRLVVVRGVANAVIDAVVADLYSSTIPATQPSSIASSEALVSPAEGTA